MKYFYRFFIVTVILAGILATSCEEKNVSDTNFSSPEIIENKGLSGNWICDDFLELVKVRASVRRVSTRPLFIEMIFDVATPDSVLLVTGYQNLVTHYKSIGKDTFSLGELLPGHTIVFTTSPGENIIVVTDSVIGEKSDIPNSWTFRKSTGKPVIDSLKGIIYSHINSAVIAGKYNQTAGNKEVFFEPDGTLKGWQGYNRYFVCAGGGCFTLTKTPMDIMAVNGEAGIIHFGFVVAGGDSLLLYRLKKMDKEEEFDYQPAGLEMTLIRQANGR